MSGQQELAEALAEEMRTCGHDVEAIDVLDALASRGMELIQPPEAATTDDYQNEIRKRLGEA